MQSQSLQPFKKTLNFLSDVLKISIMHLIATQKASLGGGYSKHLSVLKCKGLLFKKKETKKEIISSDGSENCLGILLLVSSFPGIATVELN